MTPEQFVMWLRGFFEGRRQQNGKITVEAEHMTMVVEKLASVRCGPVNPYLAASPYNDYRASVGSAVLGRLTNADVKKDTP